MKKTWKVVEEVECELRELAQETLQGLDRAEAGVLCDRLAIARQRASTEVER